MSDHHSDWWMYPTIFYDCKCILFVREQRYLTIYDHWLPNSCMTKRDKCSRGMWWKVQSNSKKSNRPRQYSLHSESERCTERWHDCLHRCSVQYVLLWTDKREKDAELHPSFCSVQINSVAYVFRCCGNAHAAQRQQQQQQYRHCGVSAIIDWGKELKKYTYSTLITHCAK